MTGEYQHTIDGKGRLFVPAKLRSDLGEFFYVTKGLDNCLFIYPAKNWADIEEKDCRAAAFQIKEPAAHAVLPARSGARWTRRGES